MTEEQFNKIKEIVTSNYNSAHCGYTEEKSQGNSTDVFEDGFNCGQSQILYEIAMALGIDSELIPPEEQEYDF